MANMEKYMYMVQESTNLDTTHLYHNPIYHEEMVSLDYFMYSGDRLRLRNTATGTCCEWTNPSGMETITNTHVQCIVQ